MGLGVIRLGFFAVGRHRPPWPLSMLRLWLIGWAMGGMAFVCLGVTSLRYAKGDYVSLPTSAPFIYKVLWVLVPVGMIGFFVALLTWMGLQQNQKRGPRSEQQTHNSASHP